MEFNVGIVIGIFVALFIIYCLYLAVIGLFKSNPTDYLEIVKLEKEFKTKSMIL